MHAFEIILFYSKYYLKCLALTMIFEYRKKIIIISFSIINIKAVDLLVAKKNLKDYTLVGNALNVPIEVKSDRLNKIYYFAPARENI